VQQEGLGQLKNPMTSLGIENRNLMASSHMHHQQYYYPILKTMIKCTLQKQSRPSQAEKLMTIPRLLNKMHRREKCWETIFQGSD
jgi:hypothetical protein